MTYLTYICWEIDNFVIKSDIFRRFFICKNILKKVSCYHDNYFRYFMKMQWFCQQGEGFCMHVFSSIYWLLEIHACSNPYIFQALIYKVFLTISVELDKTDISIILSSFVHVDVALHGTWIVVCIPYQACLRVFLLS
jgi:hypothetical protein